MKTLKKIFWGTMFMFFVLFLFWIAMGEEIYYLKTTNYVKYTIQIELLNGSKDIITTVQPEKIWFQINCHSHKGNFKGCDLEAVVPREELFLAGGHWFDIRDGVINFWVLKKEPVPKKN